MFNTETDYDLEAQRLRESLERAQEAARLLGVTLAVGLHADVTERPLSPPMAAVKLRDGDPCRTDHGDYFALHRSGDFAPKCKLIVVEAREPKAPKSAA